MHNDLAKGLGEELRAYCKETLRIWQTKVVQVLRVDVGNDIGMHGFALQVLEDLVQAVSRGKLLPNCWHFIDSMAEASDSAVQDLSRDHVSTLLRGLFRVGTGLAHVVICVIAICTAHAELQAKECEVVVCLFSQ